MTISILILFAILAAFAFYIYYKKMKDNRLDDKTKKTEKGPKRNLNEIDKMLSHITQTNSSEVEEKQMDNKEDNTAETKGKSNSDHLDLHEKVFGSIILEKKKKK
jgi:hypothetical protein